jgi:pimeloyl-ACP methyl ester carboxylesterase
MTLHAAIAGPQQSAASGISFLRRAGHGGSYPLVLLHGIGSNASSFVPVMTALPATIDVIAWNAPGYAASLPLTDTSPSPHDYAAALLRLLDAIGLKQVVLCGHSLGALFAGSFAAHYPDRVAALALTSPALGYRVPPGESLPPTVQARIDEIETVDLGTFAAKRATRLVHAPERKPQVLAAVRTAMTALNPAGYVQAVRALGAGDLLADAAAIAAPAIVAVGAEDVITPPANARSLYAALPHTVAFHEIADAGHALPQEDPAAVAGMLTQLMERLDG